MGKAIIGQLSNAHSAKLSFSKVHLLASGSLLIPSFTDWFTSDKSEVLLLLLLLLYHLIAFTSKYSRF